MSPNLPTTKRLGERLLDAEVITQDQLTQALAYQFMNECTIGNALVELDIVTMADVLNAVLEQKREQLNTARLGDLAVETGKATRSQIGRALGLSRSRHHPIGQVMVDEGILTIAEVYDLLDRQAELRGEVQQPA